MYRALLRDPGGWTRPAHDDGTSLPSGPETSDRRVPYLGVGWSSQGRDTETRRQVVTLGDLEVDGGYFDLLALEIEYPNKIPNLLCLMSYMNHVTGFV